MKPTELLRIVWINMVGNKFKVLTTSLGIIVGAITIVLVIAIGQGGEQQAAEGFSYLSADTIYINVNYQNTGMDFSRMEKLTEELMDNIMEENTGLSGIYLRNPSYEDVSIKGKKESVSVDGVTEGYADISNFTVENGRDFSEEEMEDGKYTAVIGGALAEKLFGNAENAVGKRVKIDEKNYTIIGTLKRSADGLQGLDADDTIFLPYQTMKNNGMINEYSIPQAIGKVKDISFVKQTMKQIESTMNYYMDNSSSYVVEDAGSRIEAATASARTMKMLLISVAAIVFVVGGIGIMNVLFVTVKERTKEIGVLKALGSTQGDILLQFLTESLLIGVFSGLVGVFLSIFALYFMGQTDIPVAPSFAGMVVAFGFSVVTSGIFGFYPAYKASQLKPVDALNYE